MAKTPAKKSPQSSPANWWQQLIDWVRPSGSSVHRSFRLTERRDLPKHQPLPGYLAFTGQLLGLFRAEWSLMLRLAGFHLVVSLLLVGLMSQGDYVSLTELIDQAANQVAGVGGAVPGSLLLFMAALGGGLSQTATDLQQSYLALLGLLTWLVLVWLLRQRLAGVSVKLRDGLYNAATPLIPSLAIIILGSLQLLPAAIGALVFTIAVQNGILVGGVEAAMFGVAAILLILLSLHWLSVTVIAFAIVALPGKFPWAALRDAKSLVLGRRLSVVLRLLWLALVVLVIWALVLLPMIIIDGAIGQTWLPLVPITVQLLSTFSLLVAGGYLYLLYRRMIND